MAKKDNKNFIILNQNNKQITMEEAADLTKTTFWYKKKVYNQIKLKKDYDILLNSGMLFEFYPELTGNWDIDKIVIYK